MAQYRTQPVATTGLPPGIPYIIGNEAAERFSFYGMRGILLVFMTTYLHWMTSDPNATAMSPAAARVYYHDFVRWVYFTPLLGALLADGWLGKYRTIMWLSVVYCLGHLSLAIMGQPPLSPAVWLFIGLALVALGSGGIKPCVSANVGDQFGSSNRHWLSKVYSWFYFSINAGSFISNLLTPWLLKWYGPHWAFGVPGVLMAIATVVFWMGRHKFVHVPAAGVPFLREVFSANGLWTMVKLSIIFLFVAMFWALYDQTGSSWIQQAEDLNLNWLGRAWLPAQIQAVNPIMILVFIPLFDLWIYPQVNRFFTLTPIRKISIGLFITALSFALITVIQQWIETGYQPSVGWQIVAYLVITAAEVMVSITALEFAYTQAPHRMKSIIMALFLSSVALGNTLALKVNESIQVANQLDTVTEAHATWFDPTQAVGAPDAEQQKGIEKIKDINGQPVRWESRGENAYQYVLAGADQTTGTPDDLRVIYDAQGVRRGVVTAANNGLASAAERIRAAFNQQSAGQQALPQTAAGQEAINDLRDPWGQPYQYALVNRRTFRITSLGPDGKFLTPDDLSIVTQVDFQGEAAATEEAETWLARRQRELQSLRQESSGQQPVAVEIPDMLPDVQLGGLVTLEGSAYYAFFTKLMLGTAILFVFVGLVYKPREYIQQEA
ncbi:MAG: MFS transporter [Pirellulales bacterium]